MHNFYGMTEKHDELGFEARQKLLQFRIDFLQEEIDEMKDAKSAEDIVDALIDLVVVAIGTLDAFAVDGQQAWDEVLEANMAKKAGVNPSRPNPLGLPDLIKPEGWEAPSHEGNTGNLSRLFEKPAYGPCEI